MRLLITPQAAKAVSVESQGALQGGGAGKKSVDVGLAKVKKLTLGNKVALRDQTFYIIPLPHVSAGIQLDGTVGYEVFERFVVRIDYADQKLTFIRPKNFNAADAGTPVPLKFVSGRIPAVKGSLDGLPALFWIDTGDGASLDVFSPFAKKHNLYTRYNTTPPIVTGFGAGGITNGRAARAGKLMIGAVVVSDPVVTLSLATKGAFASKNGGGNIGGKVLKRFTVAFDYANKLMYLKPNENYGKPMHYDRSGMQVKGTNRGFKVMGVMKDGPAAKSGIKVGDIITAVNGKPASKISRNTFRKMLRDGSPGTRMKLTIGEGKTAHSVTLKLRRLIPETGGLKKAA